MAYRRLEKGEIIQEGDETDGCADPWRDDPIWEPAGNIGEPAPDPQFPSHRQYRRPVCDRCDGDGKAHGNDRPFEWSGPGSCPACKGSGDRQ